jgi:hypothetical protein
MCLFSLDRDHSYPEEGEGWKVVFLETRPGERDFRTACQYTDYDFNLWLTSTQKLVSTYDELNVYETGFHIYVDRQAAIRNLCTCASQSARLIKVRYRGLLAAGRGDGINDYSTPVLVAKQMYVDRRDVFTLEEARNGK